MEISTEMKSDTFIVSMDLSVTSIVDETNPLDLKITTSLPFYTESFQDYEIPKANTVLDIYIRIVNVYIIGTLCVIAFFTNTLILIVLHNQGSKTSNTVFLQALALADLCLSGITLLYFSLRTAGVFGDGELFSYVTAIVLPLGWSAQTIGIWIITAIAVDRYFVVSRPLKAKSISTAKNARKVTVAIVIMGLFLNGPRWPKYYLDAFAQDSRIYVAHAQTKVPGWDEELYHKVYHIGISLTFIFIIPISVIIMLTTKIIRHLQVYQKQRKQLMSAAKQGSVAKDSDKSANQSKNVTFMMVIIIGVFIICEICDFTAAIFGAADVKVDPVFYQYFMGLNGIMLQLNSTVNFFLYCVFYRRFRATLVNMIFPSKTNQSITQVTNSSDLSG